MIYYLYLITEGIGYGKNNRCWFFSSCAHVHRTPHRARLPLRSGCRHRLSDGLPPNRMSSSCNCTGRPASTNDDPGADGTDGCSSEKNFQVQAPLGRSLWPSTVSAALRPSVLSSLQTSGQVVLIRASTWRSKVKAN